MKKRKVGCKNNRFIQMENGASRMTLYHGMGYKNTGSMLSAPGVRLWKSLFPAPPIHPGHFFPFPVNLELERKASTKFGFICSILIHTIQSICRNSECPKKSIEKLLFFREISGAWDSGRLDLRAPDISRAQDQPYTPQPDEAVALRGWKPSRVIRMWMFDSKFSSTSRCECFEPGAPLRKVLQGIFIDSSNRFSHTGLPHQKATKDGPANNCRKVQWRLVNH